MTLLDTWAASVDIPERPVAFGGSVPEVVMSPGVTLATWPTSGWGNIMTVTGVGPTPGQITVLGIVSDATTGKGIAGAKVVMTGAKTYSATTDANGAYSIANVAAGTYDFTFSASGYQSQTQKGVSITNNITVSVKLTKGISWLTYAAIAGGAVAVAAVLVTTSKRKG